MSFSSITLVVAAAFLHATWNLLSKRAAAGGPTFVFAYNLVACVVYAPWVACQFTGGGPSGSLKVAGCMLLSALLNLAYSLSLQRGYQVAELSVVYPVARGTGPLLASLGAFLVLGERPTGLGAVGLAAVIVGIGLISTQGSLAAFRQPAGLAGLGWGTLTGLVIASYTVVDAYGVTALAIPPVLLNWFSNLFRFVVLGPIVLWHPDRARERMKGRWPLAAAVGILSPLAYILVLAALKTGAPLSVVAPTREMSMMVGALFGMMLLHEPIRLWRLIGCLVLIAGTILLVQ